MGPFQGALKNLPTEQLANMDKFYPGGLHGQLEGHWNEKIFNITRNPGNLEGEDGEGTLRVKGEERVIGCMNRRNRTFHATTGWQATGRARRGKQPLPN